GLVSGTGVGIIYRAGGTVGGTGIVGRIIQQKTGIPLSQVYLYTDGVIILLAGFVFDWEIALHALLTLFLNGLASDFALEGPSTVRMVVIITDRPDELTQALMMGLHRGISYWPITGGYTSKTHSMILCAIYRPQVNELKRIVATVDSKAFIVIGNAHQALGSGFIPLRR
ncbi:MAG: YitT family protein, partial [Nitrospira sp.]|nr:YitT family protein [Nitrospira sp.]